MTSPRIKLSEIAHARSGDKGNHANVAVFAYTEAGFAWIRAHLSAAEVARYFLPKLQAQWSKDPANVGREEEGIARKPARTNEKKIAYFLDDYHGPSSPRVERFEAPNVRALNFMLYEFLGGGASQSLCVDTQGKTLGLALLQMELPRPANLEAMVRSTVVSGEG